MDTLYLGLDRCDTDLEAFEPLIDLCEPLIDLGEAEVDGAVKIDNGGHDFRGCGLTVHFRNSITSFVNAILPSRY